jgi:transcriptional regulator with XRE-family HTH domain
LNDLALDSSIGQRIRRMRRQQSRTLDDIAAACGFTKSLLSKIENGKTVPPVATLTKIARAFGVGVGKLVDDRTDVGTVFQAGKGVPGRLVPTDKGYEFFAFATSRGTNVMQPYLFTAQRGRVKPHALNHAGEEFVYVLSGTMSYRVGAAQYTLSEGDSLYFDAEEDHEMKPITKTVSYLGIFAERAPKKTRRA